MSLWMNIWIIYTITVTVFALATWANDRDERKLSEYYRNKWREAVESRRARA